MPSIRPPSRPQCYIFTFRPPLPRPCVYPHPPLLKRAPIRNCASTHAKKRLVFLGTPDIAAQTLHRLHNASIHPTATFDLTAVVTQPPAPSGRKRIVTKSPVHVAADELELPVLTPHSARDEPFLAALRNLQPDLCVTAAYGNFLPTAFLNVPRYGTLNIHPSLLPLFRGAAPVPRALEMGVERTGVCVLKTVLKMDAGPIVAVRERVLHGDEQAPQLLEELFEEGTHALLEVLPGVWDESVQFMEQDEEMATHAKKVGKEEARLTFTENARIVHNKVRAFAGWPGTWADFLVGGEQVRMKVVQSRVLREESGMCLGVHQVGFEDDCLKVVCDDGSVVGIVKVQPVGKKVMDAKSFWNGTRGKTVERKRVPH